MGKLDSLDARAADLAARVIPWLAPIPTAYLVGRATVEYLAWPEPVAAVAALTVEGLGLATTTTALELFQYNQTKRKTDPGAPARLAGVLVGVYFATATGLTVALDIFPQLATYAPAIFPALSLVGMAIIAMRANHRRRLAAIAEEKAERRAERQAARAHRVTPDVTPTTPNVNPYSDPDRRRKALREALQANPGLTPTEASALYGVSRPTIYNDLDRLEQAGVIRRNGHGLEVIK